MRRGQVEAQLGYLRFSIESEGEEMGESREDTYSDILSGDVEVIETEYGYHVMYFVKKHPAPYWKISIAQTFANDDLNKMLDDAVASDAYKVADAQGLAGINDKLYAKLVENFYPNVTKAEATTAAK